MSRNGLESEAQGRVFVAEDHPVVRAGLRGLIDAQPDMRLIGEANDIPSTIDRIHANKPGVLVLDLHMGGHSTVGAIESLRHASPGTAIVMLTMQDDPAFARAALDAGASGYVLKDSVATELVDALHAALAGGVYIPPELRTKLRAHGARQTT